MYFLKTLEHLESKRHDGLYGETFLEAVADAIQGITKSLHDNTELSLAGHVIRMEEKEVIVKLDAGPSFKNMLDEQRFMRSNYPEIT